MRSPSSSASFSFALTAARPLLTRPKWPSFLQRPVPPYPQTNLCFPSSQRHTFSASVVSLLIVTLFLIIQSSSLSPCRNTSGMVSRGSRLRGFDCLYPPPHASLIPSQLCVEASENGFGICVPCPGRSPRSIWGPMFSHFLMRSSSRRSRLLFVSASFRVVCSCKLVPPLPPHFSVQFSVSYCCTIPVLCKI